MNEDKDQKVSVSQQWGTSRLRLLFLLPMSIVIVLVVVILTTMLYEYTSRDVQDGVVRIRASVQDFYEESIRYDAKALQAILHALRQDKELATALAQKNRNDLLRISTPIFEDIRRDFKVTHFYFHSIDRINLLRVHTPLRFDDYIDRVTMDQAQKSGSVAYGVELGPLGTFTLRVVSPWYDKQTHKLIGYVELGMETDQVINKLHDFFDIEVFTLIHKKFLNREKWELGMRTLGRTPHWDNFDKMVASEQSMSNFPTHLKEHLKNSKAISNNSILNLEYEDQSYRITSLQLPDASGRIVAEMILLNNVSKEQEAAKNTLLVGIGIALVAGVILFVFFYWLVGTIGKRIELNEQELRKIATHDGLTGLYNHKFFYTLLESEIPRAERYNHPISLLLLEIDFFKKVNDTYGHRSGDMILKGISKLLVDSMRSIDWVCRYGGEEITILLPETDLNIAQQVAEKLRKLIELKPFDIEDEQHIYITVSIGVSTYPQHAKEASNLVSYADTALYKAKDNGRNQVVVYEPTVVEDDDV